MFRATLLNVDKYILDKWDDHHSLQTLSNDLKIYLICFIIAII